MTSEEHKNFEKMTQLLNDASIIRGLATILATQSAIIEALVQVPHLTGKESPEFNTCLERAITGLDKGLEHILSMKNTLSDKIESDPTIMPTGAGRPLRS